MTNQLPKAAQDSQALRAQVALLEQDCARLANPDYTRPFASLEDAVDRLLPYHVFAEQPVAAEDLREGEAPGATLVASRKDAWLAHCLAKAAELQVTASRLHQTLDKAEERLISRTELPGYMLDYLAMQEEEHAAHAARQAKMAAQLAAQHAQQLKLQQAQLEAQRAQAAQLEAALRAGIYDPAAGAPLIFEPPEAEAKLEAGGAGAGPAAAGAELAGGLQVEPGGSAPLGSMPLQPAGGTAPPALGGGTAVAAAPLVSAPAAAAAGPSGQQQQPALSRPSSAGMQPAPQQQQQQPAVARPPSAGAQRPAAAVAAPARPLTEAEKQAEKQKKLQAMAQRIKQRR